MKINKTLFTIVCIVLLDLIGVGILIPIIPTIMLDADSKFYVMKSAYSIKHTFLFLGLLTGMYSFMQFLAAPILGQLSDRVGRKKVLLISLFGTAISYILFAIGIITKNLPLLFFARGLDGITGGNISVAKAVIADTSEPKDRAKNFGLIGAAFGVGFILGPYLGARLSDPTIVSWFNVTTPFYFAFLLSVVNIIFVSIFLKETHVVDTLRKMEWTKSVSNLRKAFLVKSTRMLFVIEFLYYSGFSFFVTFLSVFFIQKFGMTQNDIGDFFSYLGIWIVFAQTVSTRFLARFWKSEELLTFSIISAGTIILLLLLPQKSEWVYFIIPFLAIANGLTLSNLSGLISNSVPQEKQGEILGINSSIQAFAQGFPPMLSGALAAVFVASTSILVGAILIILGGLVFVFNKHKFATIHQL